MRGTHRPTDLRRQQEPIHSSHRDIRYYTVRDIVLQQEGFHGSRRQWALLRHCKLSAIEYRDLVPETQAYRWQQSPPTPAARRMMSLDGTHSSRMSKNTSPGSQGEILPCCSDEWDSLRCPCPTRRMQHRNPLPVPAGRHTARCSVNRISAEYLQLTFP